jgi:hypothetical protein
MSYVKVARLLVLVLSSLPLTAGATAAAAAGSSITRHADELMPAEPIHSQVLLDVYIHETPASRLLLNCLSPVARSRFLDGLPLTSEACAGCILTIPVTS